MRFLMKLEIPMEAGNAALSDPEFGHKMQTALKDIGAEAAYFASMDGHRGGYIFVDMKDASQIPSIAEPFFLWLNAKVEFIPVMTPEDLGKAGLSIAAAVKKWAPKK
jgi:hypothetical protein